MAATTQATMAEAIIAAAGENETVRKDLRSNPAAVFSDAGIHIPEDTRTEFNTFFQGSETDLMPTLDAMKPGAPLTAFPSLKCSSCTVAAWSIAAVIVGIGAGALTTLGATAPVVVSLAAFAGVSAAASLAFITSLATAVGGGIGAVALKICTWMNACP